MTNKLSLSMRAALCLALACMAGQAAAAGPTDIANVPLGTSGGRAILPNLLFDLDDSGSMNWDFMPDYVSPNTGGSALTQARPCMLDASKNGSGQWCDPGDPPYAAGGPHGFNGVGYDPNFRYKPGVSTSGQPLLNPPGGQPLGASASTTTVVNDTFAKVSGQSTTNVNLATSIPDVSYCNTNNVCVRPGADNTGAVLSGVSFDSPSGSGITMSAGGFPYRTNPSNASTDPTQSTPVIFGLPEMMSIGAFARPAGGSATVTVTTVEAHGLATGNSVFVTGTTSMNVTCVAVTVTGTTTFTYTSGSTGSSSQNGSYRKCLAGTWTRSSGTVTVSTSPNAPGLQVGDVITVAPSSSFSTGAFTVTAVGGSSFQYASSTGTGSIAGFWVRSGLYNRGTTTTGAAVAYSIVPVEYCSDVNLTNCVYVLPGNTPPAGFTFPAYVRFCQTQAQALANGGIGDASGTPRCRSKYNETAGIPQYTFVRYGWFQRNTLVSSAAPFARQNRGDCANPSSCTWPEEMNNYATWYTYYRTRLQMMKASVGIAFIPFIGSPSATPPKPNAIRLGFITMHAQDSGSISTTGNKYLRIQDFDTTQATNFYNKFYANTAGNSTPLQEALARAGWIFAGKLNTGLTSGIPTTDDPIQAACQRNYTLLTTDGFWNNLSSNLPLTPAGRTIGNLDSSPSTLLGNTLVDRPITTTLDGTGATTTTFTPSGTTSEQVVCQGGNTANFPTLGGPTACGCTAKQHAVLQQDLSSGTTTTFVNGVQTGSTATTNQRYSNVTGCVEGNWVEQDTPQTVTEDQVCRRGGGSQAVFSDGSTVSCSACGNGRYVLIREVRAQTQTVVTTDGVQTQNSATVTGTTISYSTNGSTFSGTAPSGGSCAGSAPTSPLSPNPQTISAATVTTSAPGTTVAITLAPNPTTVSGGTPTSTFSAGGTASTVADTALYFYQTKLRNGTDLYGDTIGLQFGPNTIPPNTVDLSTNSLPVKAGAKDFIPYQHMVTFGIGLADGLMRFQPDYLTASSGDYFNINNGTSGTCFWTAGACNWPAPADNTSANLDDLWHAAVNGRGSYFQALNADALSTGISTVLTQVNAQIAAASASATSSPNVTPTDNQIFSTTYETNTWSGSVFAQRLDPVTGAVLPGIQWIADGQLVTKANAGTRNILTFDPASGSTRIKPFAWGSFTTLQEQNFFQNKCPSALTQCGGLSATDQATANSGANMVAFLAGDQSLEGTIYRDRNVIDPVTGATSQTVLGDTANAKPLFVREPVLNYTDAVTPSYATYSQANANRAPRVYVGANDGFLHAFDGNTGDESWAYAPRFLLPNISILADQAYMRLHRFFVDGSPEAFDVFDTGVSQWRTVLIGGAGGGGRGWYALDVTNPSSPTALWEFCQDSTLCAINDADLGLSYGNPIVGKRASDGRWVVVLTSGLNNINSGSGVGFFYVLDAITGAVLNKVSTGQGNSITPSGLMKIAAFYNAALTDATMRFIYGGDQFGNVWRLDLGAPGSAACDPPASGTGPCVSHLAQLTDGTTPLRGQPITTKMPLTLINNQRVLYVGTGRYIGDGTHGGVSDLSDPGAASGIAWLQSLYAIKDRNFDYGTAFRTGSVVRQTLSLSGVSGRNVTKNPVNWTVNDGWFLDFISIAGDPSSTQGGERVNLDPQLVLGTVAVVTNTPDPGGTCSAGGSSRLYSFDYLTGGYVGNTSTPVGMFLGAELAVGFSAVSTQSGMKAEVRLQSGSNVPGGLSQQYGGATLKRFSYRER